MILESRIVIFASPSVLSYLGSMPSMSNALPYLLAGSNTRLFARYIGLVFLEVTRGQSLPYYNSSRHTAIWSQEIYANGDRMHGYTIPVH